METQAQRYALGMSLAHAHGSRHGGQIHPGICQAYSSEFADVANFTWGWQRVRLNR